jgi:uncharacterized protein (TIGR02217 family)
MSDYFVEERFNTEIRYGVVGGPLYSTTLVETDSGVDYPNINWAEGLGEWATAQDLYNKEEIKWLLGFFHARMGRAIGFRFKDWADFEVAHQEGFLLHIEGDDFQLVHRYYSETKYTDKTVYKPVPGTVLLIEGDEFDPDVRIEVPVEDYTIDYTTGIATFPGRDPEKFYRWEGEFDKPVRFNTDKLDAEFVGYRDDGERLFNLTPLTIKEIRIPEPYTP